MDDVLREVSCVFQTSVQLPAPLRDQVLNSLQDLADFNSALEQLPVSFASFVALACLNGLTTWRCCFLHMLRAVAFSDVATFALCYYVLRRTTPRCWLALVVVICCMRIADAIFVSQESWEATMTKMLFEWQPAKDDSGNLYYHNPSTDESMWETPPHVLLPRHIMRHDCSLADFAGRFGTVSTCISL